ncbi:class D sortase [Mesobacillus foraminis]|uniref:class D sortase n=1 Tax=Mesobacillus foraminis TaxID=279826 RepID=UPI0039A0E06D
MRKLFGITLMVVGIFIGGISYVNWQTGRSSAEDMSEQEVSELQIEENLPEKDSTEIIEEPKKLREPEQAPIPSTEVSHPLGEKIAFLKVPKLRQKYSVYWGAEEDVLKKGVGMFVSELTTVPGDGGHTVLSGHRDTVFYRLDELKEGDILVVEYEDKNYSYKINNIFITDPDDRTVIVKKSSPTLTLTTCYPFNYIGDAPERYIIQAVPLDNQSI